MILRTPLYASCFRRRGVQLNFLVLGYLSAAVETAALQLAQNLIKSFPTQKKFLDSEGELGVDV